METISRWALTFLLNATWQVPVAAAVAAFAGWMMRKGPASYRHAIWVAALVAAVAVPLASIRGDADTAAKVYIPAVGDPDAGQAPIAMPAGNTAAVQQQETPTRRTVSLAGVTAQLLWGAYLLFLAFRLVRLAAGLWRTWQIRREARPAEMSAALRAVWDRAAQALRIDDARLLASTRLEGPVVVGLWRREIIVPAGLLSETSEEVLTTAIGHEMAHLARHDFALNLLYEALYLTVAFHPAAWLIRRAIDHTRELACDELVTRRLMSPGAYARAMVNIAASMTALPRPGYTLGVFDGDILEQRIRRLLDPPRGGQKRGRWLLATSLSVLAMCAFLASGLAIRARAQSPAQPEIKLGTDAYNAGDYGAAIEHYQQAVSLDPANVNARLFLANAYMRQSSTRPADAEVMTGALSQYEAILARDPHNEAAMFGVASAAGLDRWQEAHDLMRKVIATDPQNKNAYYTLGVLDWKIAFHQVQEARMSAGMPVHSYEVTDPALRKRLREQNLPHIQEGFQMLEAALRMDPNWFEALAYLNLTLRVNAAVVDSPADAASLMARADACIEKALAVKRVQEKGSTGEAPRLDPNVAPAPALLAPPPPPPPPPGVPHGEK